MNNNNNNKTPKTSRPCVTRHFRQIQQRSIGLLILIMAMWTTTALSWKSSASSTCRRRFAAALAVRRQRFHCIASRPLVGSPLNVVSSPVLAEQHHQLLRRNFARSKKQIVDPNKKLLDPLVVCGPSGVGKGTLIDEFLEDEFHAGFSFAVSHTTRKPRPKEKNGVHYHFVTRTQMEEMIANNEFVEYAEVHGNLYGTSWKALAEVHCNIRNKRGILDIDVQGVKKLKDVEKTYPGKDYIFKPKYMFVAPPDLQTLRERLVKRGTETPESIKIRLANAEKEIEYGLESDAFDSMVINSDMDTSFLDFTCNVYYMYGRKNIAIRKEEEESDKVDPTAKSTEKSGSW